MSKMTKMTKRRNKHDDDDKFEKFKEKCISVPTCMGVHRGRPSSYRTGGLGHGDDGQG